MDARLYRVALVAAALLSSLGASYRTQNFVVTANSPQLAREVADLAETYRRDLAIEWLGSELPPWREPCPIRAQADPRLGAGGETSFVFIHGQPTSWMMKIYGPHDRVLDSVLPHEVTHTIFATHFGQPLPRWADEGACTTVEHVSEKAKQQHLLIRFLTTDRGIPFNKMFAMMQYPPDMLPLYAQGYSVARYLIAQGGKQKYVRFVGEGLQTHDWNAAVRNHYGYDDLSDLQLTWNDWVQQGSPAIQPQAELLAANQRNDSLVKQASATSDDDGSTGSPFRQLAGDGRSTGAGATVKNAIATTRESGSWYARQRDKDRTDPQPNAAPRNLVSTPIAQTQPQEPPADDYRPGTTARPRSIDDALASGPTTVTRPQPAGHVKQTILEWRRDATPAPAAKIDRPPASGYYLDASTGRSDTVRR